MKLTNFGLAVVLLAAPAAVLAQPIEIYTWEDLHNMRNDLTADYILMNDLGPDDPGYDTYAGPQANGGAGWSAMGGTSFPFSGTLDGQSHELRGMAVSTFGLFGDLEGATITNLGIVAITSTIGSSPAPLAFDITGSPSTTISRVYVTSSSTWTDGMIRYALGASPSVQESWSDLNISGSREAGGIVGDGFQVQISDSYALGDVTVANADAGGLAGKNVLGSSSRSYAVGQVSASSDAGGITGSGSGVNDSSSYWDVDTSGQTTSSGGGTGLNTGQMQGAAAATNMTSFDFSNVWRTVSANDVIDGFTVLADGYPILRNVPAKRQLIAQGLLETNPPTSSASAPATRVGSDVPGTYVATDAEYSVERVELFVREENGNWQSAGLVTGNAFLYSPPATGRYYFQTMARDSVDNEEPRPTGGTGTGDASVVYNATPNGALTLNVEIGDPVTVTFPMEDDVDVTITLNNVTAAGTLTVSRTEGDVMPTGFGSGFQFADFAIDITPAGGLAFDDATIALDYEETEMDFDETLIDQAWRDDSGTVTTFALTANTTADTLEVTGAPGFSTWYFGNAAGLPIQLDSFRVE